MAGQKPNSIRPARVTDYSSWSAGCSGYRGPLFGSLALYLLVQNRVVGAKVIDLHPELAACFDVDAGVLVTDVSRRTPTRESNQET